MAMTRVPPTCILYGVTGENPDDCTTHQHERAINDSCIHGPGVMHCGHPDCIGERDYLNGVWNYLDD